MTSVGETLRRERLQRNLDLDQISRELKISSRMLAAIEADQYSRLPGSVFAKAFVRQYARLLGLDGEELAGQVQRAIEPPALALTETARPSVAPVALPLPKLDDWGSVGDGRFRMSGWLPAAALVVVVMLICSAVYAWMQRPRGTVTARATLPSPIRVQPAPPVAAAQTARAENVPLRAPVPAPADSRPAATAQAVEPPPPQTAPPAEVERAALTTPAATGPVHVEIIADETVWMLARVDGKFAFSGTLEANGRRAVDGDKDVILRLGNAGGVTISLNGKPIGPAGPKGQVRTLQLTSGGFQIVSAKPVPAAPFDPLDRL